MKLLNRIASPILALLVFPVAFFLPMFRVMIASGLASSETKTNLLNNFGLSEFISLNDIIAIIKSGGDETTGIWKTIIENISEEKKEQILSLIPGYQWIYVFIGALVVVLLVALVLAVVTAISRKPGVTVIISGLGIASTVFMKFTFDKFSEPLLNGALNFNTIASMLLGDKAESLTTGILGNLAQALFGNIASVDYMEMSIAYTVIILIFVVTLILGICGHVAYRNEK